MSEFQEAYTTPAGTDTTADLARQLDSTRASGKPRLVAAAERLAEVEVITRMGELPREWHPVEISGKPRLVAAAERLVSLGLARKRYEHGDLGVYEYLLTDAGRRVAEYLAL
jgi:hypothetical protein